MPDVDDAHTISPRGDEGTPACLILYDERRKPLHRNGALHGATARGKQLETAILARVRGSRNREQDKSAPSVECHTRGVHRRRKNTRELRYLSAAVGVQNEHGCGRWRC